MANPPEAVSPQVAVPRPPALPRRRPLRREMKAGYLFLTPWLLGFFLLTALPMLASLYLAFTDYDLFSSPQWIGLDNFERMFSDPRYRQSAQVTITYVLLGTPIKLAAALAVAMVLNSKLGTSGFLSLIHI